ncbi:MAG: FHA domain-containing protein [Butyrivibrio sp.]|nr:FHA domain-containing protein [Butyrivibrio sp.]
MNGKRFVDIMACGICMAVIILSYIYTDEGTGRAILWGVCIFLFLVFLFLAIRDDGKYRGRHKAARVPGGQKGRIQFIALLGENDNEIARWNIAGKVSLIIGRNTRKEDVDINLMNTEFAGMVDRQHAVLNYTAGQWYIEDLDSTNGIRIQKNKDQKIYEISKTQPCMIEQGDIIYIGLTKLMAV